MNHIPSGAAAARESARSGDGKFGVQSKAEVPGVTLDTDTPNNQLPVDEMDAAPTGAKFSVRFEKRDDDGNPVSGMTNIFTKQEDLWHRGTADQLGSTPGRIQQMLDNTEVDDNTEVTFGFGDLSSGPFDHGRTLP